MTTTRVVVFGAALCFPLLTGAAAQAQVPDRRAAALERLATRASSLEDFGRAVMQQAMLAAAQRIKEGKQTGQMIRIDVPLTVRAIDIPRPSKVPDLPKVPGPDDVDVCWETCNSLSCYMDCDFGGVDTGVAVSGMWRFQQCEDLRQRMSRANIREQRVLIMQRIMLGCIDLTPFLTAAAP
jgi:hypothetical protein